MIVGVLEIDLAIPHAHSLKDKRSVVKSLLARLKREHEVSAAEVDAQDEWKRAVIGVAFVSNDGRHAQSHLQKVLNHVRREREAYVVSSEIELL